MAASNTITARQFRHWTLFFSDCHPRRSSGISRSARTRSISWIAPVAASTAYGASVPQNGQTSFCLAGFHSACAPQAAHVCVSTAVTSGMLTDAPGSGFRIRAASDRARVRSLYLLRYSSSAAFLIL